MDRIDGLQFGDTRYKREGFIDHSILNEIHTIEAILNLNYNFDGLIGFEGRIREYQIRLNPRMDKNLEFQIEADQKSLRNLEYKVSKEPPSKKVALISPQRGRHIC